MKGLSRATTILAAITSALALATCIVSALSLKKAKRINRIVR
ncbi:MAG: hypothetical protein U0K95_02680 [Eubacterium sp.]|jgi:hypothetical protein|nr:hypothetical protein [Eubacterium sp.]